MTTKMPPTKNIRTARMKVMVHHPFFAHILMRLTERVRRDIWLMATDGKHLSINPEACEVLPMDQLQTVLCHEVAHVCFNHVPIMIQHRLHVPTWNKATDYAINLMLVECGLTMYDNGLYDTQWQGMSAIQIYDRLIAQGGEPNDPEPGDGEGDGQGQGDGQGPPCDGPGRGRPRPANSNDPGRDLQRPAYGNDPAEAARQAQEVRQMVAQAANMARMAGKMPGALDRMVANVLDPVVPWPAVLRDYMTRTAQDDESWSRRNRRIAHVVLPARHSTRMGPVIMIGDTSGSITNDELTRMATEVAAIAEQLNPESIRLVWADTEVAGEQVFEPGDPIVCKPTGGGGTDMRVPLTYVAQYDPQVVILATDGYTPWPSAPTPYPLIVLCTTDTTIPTWAQGIRV